jgi:hypothetical protein
LYSLQAVAMATAKKTPHQRFITTLDAEPDADSDGAR